MYALSPLAVHLLDRTVAAAARIASVFTHRLSGTGGAFYLQDTRPFLDAWAEPGALMLRLGRVEVIVDRSHG